jgi:hypothetical protein
MLIIIRDSALNSIDCPVMIWGIYVLMASELISDLNLILQSKGSLKDFGLAAQIFLFVE